MRFATVILSFSLLGATGCGGAPVRSAGLEASRPGDDAAVEEAPAPRAEKKGRAGVKDAPVEQSAEVDEERGELSPEAPSTIDDGAEEWPNREDLAQAEQSLAEALSPEALSCSGAEPHRDAICSIAARLCEYSHDHPTSVAAADCLQAKDACKNAKRDFAKNCEQ